MQLFHDGGTMQWCQSLTHVTEVNALGGETKQRPPRYLVGDKGCDAEGSSYFTSSPRQIPPKRKMLKHKPASIVGFTEAPAALNV